MTSLQRARSRPLRPDAAAAARDAFQRADYLASLALLDEAAPLGRSQRVEVAALRVRTLLRLRRNAEAVAAARDLRERARSADEIVTAAMLTAQALARTNKPAQARAVAEEARALAPKAHPAIRAELTYSRALISWTEGEAGEAERIVLSDLVHAVDGARTLLESLLGWIDVRRERYADAARHFENALDADRGAVHRDAHVVAAATLALAIIATETLAPALAERVERELERLPVVTGTAFQRGKIHDLLGIAARLRGDQAAAWRHLEAARATPAEPTVTLAATVELAALARHAGDRFVPDLLLRDAAEAARAVEWHKLDADRRMALIDLAAGLAEVDAGAATWALATYDSIHPMGDGADAFDADRRPFAARAVAAARVAAARGEHAAAVAGYRRALEVFGAIGYRRRACEVQLDLYRLTGEERWLRDAEGASAALPDSYLAREASRSRLLGARQANLSDMERRVLAALVEGKSASAIAAEFGRSVNTINNHTKRVFKALGVRSRSALLAEYVQLGPMERP